MNKINIDNIVCNVPNYKVVQENKPALYINGDSFNQVTVTFDGVDYSFPVKTFAQAILKIMKEVENENTV